MAVNPTTAAFDFLASPSVAQLAGLPGGLNIAPSATSSADTSITSFAPFIVGDGNSSGGFEESSGLPARMTFAGQVSEIVAAATPLLLILLGVFVASKVLR